MSEGKDAAAKEGASGAPTAAAASSGTGDNTAQNGGGPGQQHPNQAAWGTPYGNAAGSNGSGPWYYNAPPWPQQADGGGGGYGQHPPSHRGGWGGSPRGRGGGGGWRGGSGGWNGGPPSNWRGGGGGGGPPNGWRGGSGSGGGPSPNWRAGGRVGGNGNGGYGAPPPNAYGAYGQHPPQQGGWGNWGGQQGAAAWGPPQGWSGGPPPNSYGYWRQQQLNPQAVANSSAAPQQPTTNAPAASSSSQSSSQSASTTSASTSTFSSSSSSSSTSNATTAANTAGLPPGISYSQSSSSSTSAPSASPAAANSGIATSAPASFSGFSIGGGQQAAPARKSRFGGPASGRKSRFGPPKAGIATAFGQASSTTASALPVAATASDDMDIDTIGGTAVKPAPKLSANASQTLSAIDKVAYPPALVAWVQRCFSHAGKDELKKTQELVKAKIEAITNARGKSGLHAIDWNNEPRVGAPDMDDDCMDESVSGAAPPLSTSSSSSSYKSPSQSTNAYINSYTSPDARKPSAPGSHSAYSAGVRPPKYQGPGALSSSDVYRGLPPPMRASSGRRQSSSSDGRREDKDRESERDRTDAREFDGGMFDSEGREKDRAARLMNSIHPDRRHHHAGGGGAGGHDRRRERDRDRRSYSPDDRRGGRGRSDSGGDRDRSPSPYTKRVMLTNFNSPGRKKIKKQKNKKQKGKKRLESETKNKFALAEDSFESERRRLRSRRFNDRNKSSVPKYTGSLETHMSSAQQESSDDVDFERMKVVGTSKNLEKKYFRLTSAPDPSQIRPEIVLRKSLDLAAMKWERDKSYPKFLEQLKSIRQDLKVQHIKNGFTVKVYEANARVSLRMGDMSEFNQCQTQLKELYDDNPAHREHIDEFRSYRLLYFTVTKANAFILKFLQEVERQEREIEDDSAVAQSLEILSALKDQNYVRFFQLYKAVKFPEARFILKNVLPDVRFQALIRICNSYMSFPVAKAQEVLGFESLEECERHLDGNGMVFKASKAGNPRAFIDCKKCTPRRHIPNTGPSDEERGVTHGSLAYRT